MHFPTLPVEMYSCSTAPIVGVGDNTKLNSDQIPDARITSTDSITVYY